MRITISLRGSLCKYSCGEKIIDLPQATVVKDIIIKIGVPHRSFSFVMINGSKVSLDHKLQENDRVVVFPLVSGG